MSDKQTWDKLAELEARITRLEAANSSSPSPPLSPLPQTPTPLYPPTAPPPPTDKSKGTRLPTEWKIPEAWGRWALRETFGEKPQYAVREIDLVKRWAEDFRDHWHSTPGERGRKSDWQATWRKWVRRAGEKMPAWAAQRPAGAAITAGGKPNYIADMRKRLEGAQRVGEVVDEQ